MSSVPRPLLTAGARPIVFGFYLLSPVSYVLCPMSYVLCPMSYVLCPMSYVLCPMSYVLCPMSYVLSPMSDLLSPIFCLLYSSVGAVPSRCICAAVTSVEGPLNIALNSSFNVPRGCVR
jgi:hypothetical protein